MMLEQLMNELQGCFWFLLPALGTGLSGLGTAVGTGAAAGSLGAGVGSALGSLGSFLGGSAVTPAAGQSLMGATLGQMGSQLLGSGKEGGMSPVAKFGLNVLDQAGQQAMKQAQAGAQPGQAMPPQAQLGMLGPLLEQRNKKYGL